MSNVLNDVEVFLERFVVYPSEYARVAHVLWIAHSWRMDAWESTPRIAFLSPEPGSGKTRALEVTELLAPRPVLAVNCTSAFLFRRVADPVGLPTILFDEIDTVFGPRAKSENEDIRGLLNAGHRKGAVAGRRVVKGKRIETEELAAYCAVALAGLEDLPDTLMSRSVVIRMRRRVLAPGAWAANGSLPLGVAIAMYVVLAVVVAAALVQRSGRRRQAGGVPMQAWPPPPAAPISIPAPPPPPPGPTADNRVIS